jgi:hypothetical protein
MAVCTDGRPMPPSFSVEGSANVNMRTAPSGRGSCPSVSPSGGLGTKALNFLRRVRLGSQACATASPQRRGGVL